MTAGLGERSDETTGGQYVVDNHLTVELLVFNILYPLRRQVVS